MHLLHTDHNFAVRGYWSSVASPCSAWRDSKRLNLCAGILPLPRNARCYLARAVQTLTALWSATVFSPLFLKDNTVHTINFIAACACISMVSRLNSFKPKAEQASQALFFDHLPPTATFHAPAKRRLALKLGIMRSTARLAAHAGSAFAVQARALV